MRRPAPALLTGALSLALAASLSAAAPAAGDPGGPPLTIGQGTTVQATSDQATTGQADEALATVEGLLDEGVDGSGSRGTGAAAAVEADEGHDLTLALRDLAVARPALDDEDRAAADAYLARPTDRSGAPFGVRYSVREERPLCSTDVCVHHVGSTGDAADRSFARTTLNTVQAVHNTYVAAGYRAPLPDRRAARNGGDAKTDVYLADLGDQGVYGYCTTDQVPRAGRSSAWAYCVLDNDYSPDQYPSNTPVENMRVTAAHEYFHAVQFGYDYLEDAWFMEGTATWAEDELFDDVDDNRSYLDQGPLGAPARSLDLNDGALAVYGSWSFFRYLTERFPTARGGLPTLVRQAWERADARGDAPDAYSLQALRRVVAGRGTTFRDVFADYVAANRFPARTYSEGASWPVAPLGARATLGAGRSALTMERRLNHLAGATARAVPARELTSPRQRVSLRVGVPPVQRGAEVRVTVDRTDGTSQVTEVVPGRDGRARVLRPFTAGEVAGVEVHLVNASTRIRNCFSSDSAISCRGFAVDDRLPFAVTARLVR